MSLAIHYNVYFHIALIVIFTIFTALVCSIPTILSSIIYYSKTEKTFFQNLRIIYPKFLLVGLIVAPNFFMLFFNPSDDAHISLGFPVTIFILSTFMSFYLLSILIWRQYIYNSATSAHKSYTMVKFLSNPVSLVFCIGLLFLFLYGILFLPTTGPSIACDEGFMTNSANCVYSTDYPATSDLHITTQKANDQMDNTYNVEIKLRSKGTATELYAIQPDGSRTPSISSVGQNISIDSVKRGEDIKIIGRLRDGSTGVAKEYTVSKGII